MGRFLVGPLFTLLERILKNQGTIMAQIDDLNTAVAALGAAVDALAARVAALPAAPDLSADIAAVNDAVTKLNGIAPAA